MTDAAAPRIRPGAHRTNPAPRPALPRVTPLSAAGDLPGAAAEGSPAAPTTVEAEVPATGRDLLIPSGVEQTRRKGRGSATVPTLAELMPPPDQRGNKKAHPPAPARVGLDRPERVAAKGKHGKGKAAQDEPVKEVALQVTLSKGLRKRLKAKAADLGLSPEGAVAQLVEVWVDG